MAKQLVIDMRAIDNISPATRQAVANMLLVGDATIKTEKAASSALSKMASSVFSLKGFLVGAAAAVGVGLGARATWAGLVGAAEEMDHIGDEAARLKLTTQEMSSLRYTADIANVSFGALTDGIYKAQRAVGEFIQTGGGRAAPALRALNVQLVDGRGNVRQMNELLPDFIDALNQIDDGNKRNYLAAKIFGDGPEFIRLLAEGGDRLRAINREAGALGVIFTPEQIRIANEFRDSLDRVKQAWFGVKAAAVVASGPWLTNLLNQSASAIAAVPAMVGNLMGAFGQALGNGPQREAARAKFRAFIESLGDVALVGLKYVFGAIEVGSLVAIDYVFDKIGMRGTARIEETFLRWKVDVARYAIDVFKDDMLLSRVFPGAIKMAEGALDLFQPILEKHRAGLGTTASAVEAYTRAWDDDLLLQVRNRLAGISSEADASTGALLKSLDALIGYNAALANSKLPELPQRSGLKIEKVDKRPDWLKGAGQGFSEFMNKIEQESEYGRQAFTQMADSGVDNLTLALVDTAAAANSVDGAIKQLGVSMKQFGAQTLRMLSEVITKFLVLRLVSGVGGALAGGAAGGGGSAPIAMNGPDVIVNTGGVIEGRGRVRRYALGGIAGAIGFASLAAAGVLPQRFTAGGMVPAMLTPGEVTLEPGTFDPQRLHAANAGRSTGAAHDIVARTPGARIVRGPDIDRDIVPAMLPVGTGVLSRTGVKHYARGGMVGGSPDPVRNLLPAMRSPRRMAEGGVATVPPAALARPETIQVVQGGSVAIHIHSDGKSSVSGAPTTASIDKQIADAIVRILHERPAVRDLVRSIK